MPDPVPSLSAPRRHIVDPATVDDEGRIVEQVECPCAVCATASVRTLLEEIRDADSASPYVTSRACMALARLDRGVS